MTEENYNEWSNDASEKPNGRVPTKGFKCPLCGGISLIKHANCNNCLGSLGNKEFKHMTVGEMYNEIAKIDSLVDADRNLPFVIDHRRLTLEAIEKRNTDNENFFGLN